MKTKKEQLEWLRREQLAAQRVLGFSLRRAQHLRESGASADDIAIAECEAAACEKMLDIFQRGIERAKGE